MRRTRDIPHNILVADRDRRNPESIRNILLHPNLKLWLRASIPGNGSTWTNGVGSVAGASLNTVSWLEGPRGLSPTFNGSSGSYAQIPYDVNLESDVCTVALWIKPTYGTVTYNPCICALRDGTSTRWSWHFGNQGGGSIPNDSTVAGSTAYMGVYNNSLYRTASGPTVPKNEWSHIAVVISSGGSTYYLNGEHFGTSTTGRSANGSKPFNIAVASSPNTEPLAGSFADLMFYNVGLDVRSIKKIYEL